MKKFILTIFLMCFSLTAKANDVTITNFAVGQLDRANRKLEVTFDISWNNSWILPDKNFDAAWIFMKFYDPARRCYRKCTISSVSSLGSDGDSDGEPDTVDAVMAENGVGFFLHRLRTDTANYFGALSRTGVKILWDYPADLQTDLKVKSPRLKIFAIEMAYVPRGEYYLGDGAGGLESHNAFHEMLGGAAGTEQDNTAFQVESGWKTFTYDEYHTTRFYGVNKEGGLGIASGSLPDYPVGGKSFYCMKYELSQGQYRDFLNTLSRQQQTEHVLTNIGGGMGTGLITNVMVMTNTEISDVRHRQIISLPSSANPPYLPLKFGCNYNVNDTFDEFDDGECIAMGHLDWIDFASYADWAGLRPMTELEYEKACKGPVLPQAGEYAWGSNAPPTFAVNVNNPGTKFESVSEKGFGLVYLGPFSSSGPLRSGFAAEAFYKARGEYGASCWGILDLTGNQAEWVIGIDGYLTYNEYNYTGNHGDGNLPINGIYDVVDWPPSNKSGSDPWYNPKLRGGVYNPDSNTMELMPVAARYLYPSGTSVVVRHGRSGGRFVRTGQ